MDHSRANSGKFPLCTAEDPATLQLMPEPEPRPEAPVARDEDTPLLQACLAGDPKALEGFIKRVACFAYAGIRAQLHGSRWGHADCLDLTQVVLIQVFCDDCRGLRESRVADGPAFRGWLAAVIRSRVHDMLRKAKVRKAYQHDSLDGLGDLAAHDEDLPGSGLYLSSERAELVRRMRDLVAKLPEAQRAALLARFQFPEATNHELATRLGVPAGTFATNLRRARANIENMSLQHRKQR
jgi:RNA polymerase sigma factor (sigma-70 family)